MDIKDTKHMRNPIVFAPHQPMMRSPSTGALVPKIDLKNASKYGEIRCLLDWPEIRDMNMPLIYEKLANGLTEYQKGDFILVVGNPVAMTITTMMAADINDGCVTLLYWNKPSGGPGSYQAVDVDMNDADLFWTARN